MDVVTHFLLPYSAALFALGLHRPGRQDGLDKARRAHLQAAAVYFGLGGFAPDLDGLVAGLRHLPGLYWIQHRGLSHTLLGAPLFALLACAIPLLLAVWRPHAFGRLRLRWSFAVVAMLGGFTHLVLDSITYSGVPLTWPFGDARGTIGPFHWLVPWLFPVSLLIVLLHAWRNRLRTMDVAWFGAFLVVLLVIVAGVRVHYQPDVADAEVFARRDPTEWIVVHERADGYEAVLYDLGRPVAGSSMFFPVQIPDDTQEVVARARDTDAYGGYRMGLVGPEAVTVRNMTDPPSGVPALWNVTFTDVAARYEALHDPRWTPARVDHEWGYVRFLVDNDHVEVLHAGW